MHLYQYWDSGVIIAATTQNFHMIHIPKYEIEPIFFLLKLFIVTHPV